jgi:hypothetical protein
VNDRAERIHRAELHTRNSSPHSCRTPVSAHRPGIDRWLSRQLLAERAWTRRSVLGGPSDGIFPDGVRYRAPTMTAEAATGGYAAELTVGIA